MKNGNDAECSSAGFIQDFSQVYIGHFDQQLTECGELSMPVSRPAILTKLSMRLDNLNARTEWVKDQLEALPQGALILDAGCGSQQFRKYCEHLDYRSQDFGKYTKNDKVIVGSTDQSEDYQYGKLDYRGDIWNISEEDNTFDAILCTEVLEHIPYPNEAVGELSRLLKPGGKLILTAPSNCLRHMDPYFFYSGFSDRWYESILPSSGLKIISIEPVGDYYSWISVELYRSIRAHSFFARTVLLPAFLYFLNKKKTKVSVDTLCMGYHVVAIKS